MAPKLLGFDLNEMHWSAFKSSNMFVKGWHLRAERFSKLLLGSQVVRIDGITHRRLFLPLWPTSFYFYLVLSYEQHAAFATVYHLDHTLRPSVVYQLAMLVCLAAECTATYSLSKYQDLQKKVEKTSPYAGTASLYNNDIVNAEILTIVFCVFVATIFGADFFFLLFFPKRTYPRWYNLSRKAAAVAITAGLTAAAIYSTVSCGF